MRLAVAALLLLAAGVLAQTESASPAARFPFRLRPQDSWAVEVLAALLAAAVLLTRFVGRRKNQRLAIEYVAELVRPDGVVLRQFAEAESQVIVEAPDVFKFYATGRRYCSGALFTFRMAPRQDFVTMAMRPGARDALEIEVNVNEGAMPPTVLFVGVPSAAKAVIRDHRDVSELTKRLEPTRDRLATWPTEDVIVMAEQSSIFYEIFSPQVMDAVFGPAAWEIMGRHFKSLHISSEYKAPEGGEAVGATGKRPVIRLTLAPPPPGGCVVLDKAVALIGLLLDGLAAVKLSPEATKKAAEARRKAEVAREAALGETERKLEARRAEKEAKERERLAKLPPEQRERERAKREAILRQRQVRKLVKKM